MIELLHARSLLMSVSRAQTGHLDASSCVFAIYASCAKCHSRLIQDLAPPDGICRICQLCGIQGVQQQKVGIFSCMNLISSVLVILKLYGEIVALATGSYDFIPTNTGLCLALFNSSCSSPSLTSPSTASSCLLPTSAGSIFKADTHILL